MGETILLVGHCGPDTFALRSAMGRFGRVEMVNDAETLSGRLADASLLLVNRVLDGRFATESGIELIRELSGDGSPALMLVSNYPEAQAEAEAAGAVPGFGKAELYDEQTAERVQAALAHRGDA